MVEIIDILEVDELKGVSWIKNSDGSYFYTDPLTENEYLLSVYNEQYSLYTSNKRSVDYYVDFHVAPELYRSILIKRKKIILNKILKQIGGK
jgi:hypothetical protein